MVPLLIPVVLSSGSLAAAVTGLKKAWYAKQNFNTAKDRISAAEQQWREAATALNTRREAICTQLNALGTQRMHIFSKSIARFAHLMDQVAGSDLDGIHIDARELPIEKVPKNELENASYQATDFLRHGVQSATVGAMVGAGLGQTVSMLGAASTGTAISGLSGAAATNATLAWLGGGSLSSGGLGMAGGKMVLGAAMAGPTLLVMGYLAAGKSEEALTQAIAHSAEIEKSVEHLVSISVALDAIDARAQELAWVLQALDERFQTAANRVSRMVGRVRRDREAIYLDASHPVPGDLATQKIEYAKLSDKDQSSFNAMIALGSALYHVAKVEILDNDGRVTDKSAKTIEEMQHLLEQA